MHIEPHLTGTARVQVRHRDPTGALKHTDASLHQFLRFATGLAPGDSEIDITGAAATDLELVFQRLAREKRGQT